MRTALQMAFAITLGALIGGCATKNDAGVTLHKKPDLSKVTPGTPVSKIASLKKPIKREVITKGKLKGAEAWLFEWDAPNDEVNNKMYTSVVVKDGVVVAYVEDTPDKWRKDPKLHEAAKLASSWENIGGHMARSARYQAVANYFASRPAPSASRFDPIAASQNFSTYKPWENAQPVNYGMVGGSPIGFGGQQASTTRSTSAFNPPQVYPTIGVSGVRDYSKPASGVVQDGMVYPTVGASGVRDYSKPASGVVQDGKAFPTIGASGVRDYSRQQSGVVE